MFNIRRTLMISTKQKFPERKLVGICWKVTKLVASPCLFVHCSIPTGKCCNASVAREENIKL